MNGDRPGSRTRVEAVVVEAGQGRSRTDNVATEEPLEIRLVVGGEPRSVALTMRTPGSDFELAAGFLFSEGIINSREDVAGIAYCLDASFVEEQRYNIVSVTLRAGVAPDLAPLERHFLTTSACGVCGRASLEALSLRGCGPLPEGPEVEAAVITSLPAKLRQAQKVFDVTGGLHAAALFDAGGSLLAAREDVGRHNAVDKLVGWALLEGLVPLRDAVLVVSGRTSYEIVQKALVAGVPMVCAVSAPSSLAVSLAQAFAITLVGFLREARFNVYAGSARVRLDPAPPSAGSAT